mmetsp:Transcript_3577/g.14095  ORF Transcript_3577/g.14095 Transcript_3577/m.14095 type:complete len:204 (-) Transcript_3577:872-1483(-)
MSTAAQEADEQIPDDHENRPVTERGDPLQADRYARCQHSNHLRHHHEVADRIDVRDGVDTRPAEERIIQSNVGVGEVELFLGLRRFSLDLPLPQAAGCAVLLHSGIRRRAIAPCVDCHGLSICQSSVQIRHEAAVFVEGIPRHDPALQEVRDGAVHAGQELREAEGEEREQDDACKPWAFSRIVENHRIGTEADVHHAANRMH